MTIDPLARLSIHTMTTKPWSLEQAVLHYARAGVRGITVWRQHLEPYGAARARRMLMGAGLTCTALCRGGFFPATDSAGRMAAIDDNRRAIADAAALGAPMLVLVCGAVPGLPLGEARRMIRDGIQAIEPEARAAGVVLAVEPLHPMYAADRSAITTLAEARRLCERVASPFVKIAYDVFHVWWDPDLEEETARCRDLIAGFHICDWRHPLRDPLNDRAIMGEGVIPITGIRQQVRGGGFAGWDEVEIFSDALWAKDQAEVLDRIVRAYRALGT
jgi:sugar phosphate isomerase/epimerase